MRVTSILTLIVVSLVGSAAMMPLSAAQDLPLLPPPPTFAPPPAPRPFGNLFGRERPPKAKPLPLLKRQALEAQAAARLAQENQRPAIACPMTLVPADPKFDAAIRRDVPANGPAFTIRSVAPPACQP